MAGGGARGFAHIGVLQWLDEHRATYRPIYDRDGWVVWKRTV